MTMKVRISNEGPEPYVAIVSKGDSKVATLGVGEATEQYVWSGGTPLTVTEEGK